MQRRIAMTLALALLASTLIAISANASTKNTNSYPGIGLTSLAEYKGQDPDKLSKEESWDPAAIHAHAERTRRTYRSPVSDGHSVDPLPSQNADPALALDRPFLEECRRRGDQERDLVQTAAGWVKNHFDWCQVSVVRMHIGGQEIFKARLVRVGQSSNLESTTRIYHMVDRIEDPENRVDEFAFRFTSECDPAPGQFACHVDTKGNSYQTLRQWEQAGSPGVEPPVYHEIKSVSTGGRAASDSVRQNSVRTKGQMGFIGAPPHSSDDSSSTTPLRCDTTSSSADPELESEEGCIFNNVIPFLQYSRRIGIKHRDVALHLQRAFDDPANTLPSVPNKSVPGKYGTNTYLTKTTNREIRRKNRDAARAVCLAYDSAYASKGLECDEFPFSSTAEGGASGVNYSAWPLFWEANRSAGGLLVAFYKRDRIINGTKFQVSIIK